MVQAGQPSAAANVAPAPLVPPGSAPTPYDSYGSEGMQANAQSAGQEPPPSLFDRVGTWFKRNASSAPAGQAASDQEIRQRAFAERRPVPGNPVLSLEPQMVEPPLPLVSAPLTLPPSESAGDTKAGTVALSAAPDTKKEEAKDTSKTAASKDAKKKVTAKPKATSSKQAKSKAAPSPKTAASGKPKKEEVKESKTADKADKKEGAEESKTEAAKKEEGKESKTAEVKKEEFPALSSVPPTPPELGRAKAEGAGEKKALEDTRTQAEADKKALEQAPFESVGAPPAAPSPPASQAAAPAASPPAPLPPPPSPAPPPQPGATPALTLPPPPPAVPVVPSQPGAKEAADKKEKDKKDEKKMDDKGQPVVPPAGAPLLPPPPSPATTLPPPPPPPLPPPLPPKSALPEENVYSSAAIAESQPSQESGMAEPAVFRLPESRYAARGAPAGTKTK